VSANKKLEDNNKNNKKYFINIFIVDLYILILKLEMEFFIKLHVDDEFELVEGESLLEAATILYEKKINNNDEFMVGILGMGYESHLNDSEDNIRYFCNSVVAANAGDHAFSKALDDYSETID